MAGPAAEAIDTTVRLLFADGTGAVLDEREPPPPPGSVTALRGAAGAHEGVLDAFWCRLPEPPEDPGLRRRLQRRRALALAVLARGDSSGLLEVLAQRTPGGAHVVCSESFAAVLGSRHDAARGHDAVRDRHRRRHRRSAPRGHGGRDGGRRASS